MPFSPMSDPTDRLGSALEDRYRSFLAEIVTTAGLQHPHILPLFDSGEADGFPYYVMPYVEGESLRERLDRESQLPVHEAVGIATKVAGALAYFARSDGRNIWVPTVFRDGNRAIQTTDTGRGDYILGVNLETGDTVNVGPGIEPTITTAGQLFWPLRGLHRPLPRYRESAHSRVDPWRKGTQACSPAHLTLPCPSTIIHLMRCSRPFRNTALLLLALSGALSTGLPSHHHHDAGPPHTDVEVVSADHHSHGTRLVEQDERTPSGAPHLVTAAPTEIEVPAPPTAAVSPVAVRALHPTERAPPPGAPRAPPHPA